MDKTIPIFIIFLITFSGLMLFMPNELFESGYTGMNYYIPEEFEAWTLIPRDYSIEHTLLHGGALGIGGEVQYNFNNFFNSTQIYRIDWNRFPILDNRIHVKGIVGSLIGGIRAYNLNPVIDDYILSANWDSNTNESVVLVRDFKTTIELIFIDTNVTRNDIETAFDDRELNCTVIVPSSLRQDDDLGARDILIAIMSFRVPSVFGGVHPLLGFILSALFMVPLFFVFFTVIMWAIHGE